MALHPSASPLFRSPFSILVSRSLFSFQFSFWGNAIVLFPRFFTLRTIRGSIPLLIGPTTARFHSRTFVFSRALRQGQRELDRPSVLLLNECRWRRAGAFSFSFTVIQYQESNMALLWHHRGYQGTVASTALCDRLVLGFL